MNDYEIVVILMLIDFCLAFGLGYLIGRNTDSQDKDLPQHDWSYEGKDYGTCKKCGADALNLQPLFDLEGLEHE